MSQPEVEVLPPLKTEAAILNVRSRGYLSYSPEQKAEVIAAVEANGGNLRATAEAFGISWQTIQYWMKNAGRWTEFYAEKRRDLGDKLESLGHQVLDSMDCHDLSIVPFRDKAVALGVIIEKMQLVRGLPTSITENTNVESRQVLALLIQAVGGQIADSGTQDIVESHR